MLALGRVSFAERTRVWLRSPRRRPATEALPWQAETLPEPEKPPRPNAKFNREDIHRIKESGPTLEDTKVTVTTYEEDDTIEHNVRCVLAAKSKSHHRQDRASDQMSCISFTCPFFLASGVQICIQLPQKLMTCLRVQGHNFW
jgi:hypothetical protein